MVQFFESIPPWLIPWTEAQKVFWVATAPLAEDGHVNVSPKGCFEKTLNLIRDEESDADPEKQTSRAVWYEDLTGSGVETIAHIRENGRVTLMLTAFEGPPRITRFYGTGKVFEFGTPEYERLLPPLRRQPGSRAVIWVDVHKVSTSCGYSIPFFEYKAPRVKLHKFAVRREGVDAVHEEGRCAAPPSLTSLSGDDVPNDSVVLVNPLGDSQVLPTSSPATPKELPEDGMKYYWKVKNIKSIDGLPGMEHGYESRQKMGKFHESGEVYAGLVDDESEKKVAPQAQAVKPQHIDLTTGGREHQVGNVILGFGAGLLVGVVLSRWR